MFEHWTYLLVLLISLTGLAVLDYRFKLAFGFDARRAVRTIGLGVIIFVLWDIAGIGAGIFFIGDSPYLSGVRLGPEFPLEELFFLCLLCYSALLLMRGMEKLWPRT